ncbi:Ribonuclease H domain [Sesbania bispinosa]|nr:Ribonuclease H domain [Sesbania bispinosa]
MDLRQWIISNLEKKSSWKDNLSWGTTFAIAIWLIWLDINECVFSQKNPSADRVLQKLNFYTASHLQSASSLDWISNSRSYAHVLVGWDFPPQCWVKCNVDVSMQEDGSLVGCGECFRDSSGRWLSGFIRRLGRSFISGAELWAIYIAIVVAKDANIPKLIIESDSQLAVSLITNGCNNYHPCRHIVHLIRSLIAGNDSIIISYVFREANRSADALAKLALHHPMGLYLLNDPPLEVFQFICGDVMRASFIRKVPL